MNTAHLFKLFKSSSRWSNMAPSTRKAYEAVFQLGVVSSGNASPLHTVLAADFNESHYMVVASDLHLSDSGRHKLGCVLKTMFEWAIENGLRTKPFNYSRRKGWRSVPIPAWAKSDVESYIRKGGSGSTDVRAVALMFYTGQRVGDVLNMKWSNLTLDHKYIHVIQQKTGRSLKIPVHPMLGKILRLNNGFIDGRKYLVTNTMTRMSYDALRKAVYKRCEGIGVTPRPMHGLRKAAAIHLAEAGCTPHEIMSITGHASLKEVERYTLEVEQARLADRAMVKIMKTETRKEPWQSMVAKK